jgi:hypothetical protein
MASGRAKLIALPIFVAATIGSLGASIAAAQSAPESRASPPNAPASRPSVDGYGDQDKLCLAWNDGCVTCRRDAATGAACSNIGIACQPKEIACTQRQAEPAK